MTRIIYRWVGDAERVKASQPHKREPRGASLSGKLTCLKSATKRRGVTPGSRCDSVCSPSQRRRRLCSAIPLLESRGRSPSAKTTCAGAFASATILAPRHQPHEALLAAELPPYRWLPVTLEPRVSYATSALLSPRPSTPALRAGQSVSTRHQTATSRSHARCSRRSTMSGRLRATATQNNTTSACLTATLPSCHTSGGWLFPFSMVMMSPGRARGSDSACCATEKCRRSAGPHSTLTTSGVSTRRAWFRPAILLN